jgi:hypothetical protein
MNEQKNSVYIVHEILPIYKDKEILPFIKTGKSWGTHAKLNKPDREGQISHDLYMWNLKTWTWRKS